jgi:hypothetical protein
VLFHQDNAPCHKSIKTWAKLHELGHELLPAHPTYSPDLAPSDFFLIAGTSKECLLESTNEEVIAETEAYFGGYFEIVL